MAADRATALDFRARGEHRLLWPTVDFAAQYALLATFNNYQDFFRAGSFQQHNATIGVVIRFPFLNFSQREHAQAADADALRAHRQVEDAKSQVSEETLKLQRSVEQLAAAQDVADLQYQIAQSKLSATANSARCRQRHLARRRRRPRTIGPALQCAARRELRP